MEIFVRIKLIYQNGSLLLRHITARFKALGLTALKEELKETTLHEVILTAA